MSDRLNRQQIRRLNEEFQQLQELEKNGGGYRCHFNDADMSEFKMTITGPENTSYEDGQFLIKFEIGADYPATAPIVTFVTPILHPNIATCGTVCHELLLCKPKGMYDSNVTLTSIVLSMQLLLSNPYPDDPINTYAAIMLQCEPVEYDLHVRKMIQKNPVDGSYLVVAPEKIMDLWWQQMLDGIGEPNQDVQDPLLPNELGTEPLDELVCAVDALAVGNGGADHADGEETSVGNELSTGPLEDDLFPNLDELANGNEVPDRISE